MFQKIYKYKINIRVWINKINNFNPILLKRDRLTGTLNQSPIASLANWINGYKKLIKTKFIIIWKNYKQTF